MVYKKTNWIVFYNLALLKYPLTDLKSPLPTDWVINVSIQVLKPICGERTVIFDNDIANPIIGNILVSLKWPQNANVINYWNIFNINENMFEAVNMIIFVKEGLC